MARLIKKKQEKRWITTLKKEGGNGEETSEQKEIQRIFEIFYSKLYLKKEVDNERLQQYLESVKFKEPNEEIKQILNGVIMREEVEKAICDLKLNKALGPDGFTTKFFRIMKDEICDFLQRLMNEVIRTKEVPDTWKEANISLLPKEGGDLKEPKNYRPISLLNTDYKIFAKILAERLKEF